MNDMPTKILVTGLGVVSCAGHSPDAFWNHFSDKDLRIQEWPLPPESMKNRLYYAVSPHNQIATDTSANDHPDQGRAFGFALEAARAALNQGNWSNDPTRSLGVTTGTGMGTYDHIDTLNPDRGALTERSSNFFDIAGRLAEALHATGPSLNVSTACAAGAYSMALAFEAIRYGEADAVLAGGAEAFSVIPQGCFNRLGALDGTSCRPFAHDRQGTLFGEGAAYLLLESEQAFVARGGRHAVAELRGYGMSCDGHHVTAPESSGEQIEKSARQALERAGWDRPVSAVVAHGTGTQLNDKIESDVMARVLGHSEYLPWMVPLKGRIGHGGGSAGAFSSLLACILLQRQGIPPCGIQGEVDPSCSARFNHGRVLPTEVDSVLVNAYAFGGNNISLLFTAVQESLA